MPNEPRRTYWDANVPLSYVNEVSDRLPVIEELLRQARAGEIELLTSVLSKVEVAFGDQEKQQGELDSQVEERIDALWAPGSPISSSSSTS